MEIVYVGPPGTGNNTEFSYDGLGRNVKIVEKTSYLVTETRQFVGENENRYEERDASGSVTKRFFSRGQMNGSTSLLITKDHLQSTREVLDIAGLLVAEYCYDPFGQQLGSAAGPSDFRYAGLYFHSRSGLNLSWTREYSSVLGRWTSRDPVKERAGVNLYAYVKNNVLLDRDPFGLFPVKSLVRPTPIETQVRPNPSGKIIDPLWMIHPDVNKGYWKKVPNPALQDCFNSVAIWEVEEKKRRDEKVKKRQQCGNMNFEPVKTDEEIEDEAHEMRKKCRETHPKEVWRWFPGVEA